MILWTVLIIADDLKWPLNVISAVLTSLLPIFQWLCGCSWWIALVMNTHHNIQYLRKYDNSYHLFVKPVRWSKQLKCWQTCGWLVPSSLLVVKWHLVEVKVEASQLLAVRRRPERFRVNHMQRHVAVQCRRHRHIICMHMHPLTRFSSRSASHFALLMGWGAENAGQENAGMENDEQNRRSWKCRSFSCPAFSSRQFCPSFSSPAFSTSCFYFVRHFPVLHFQSTPLDLNFIKLSWTWSENFRLVFLICHLPSRNIMNVVILNMLSINSKFAMPLRKFRHRQRIWTSQQTLF